MEKQTTLSPEKISSTEERNSGFTPRTCEPAESAFKSKEAATLSKEAASPSKEAATPSKEAASPSKETAFRFSFFEPPIQGFLDERNGWIKAATEPKQTIDLRTLVRMITSSPRLRERTEQVHAAAQVGADRFSAAKLHLLPFFTPFCICSQRQGSGFQKSSHAIVIDIDHLASEDEAKALRDCLFRDPYLHPILCFVSPSGKGVKTLVPIRLHPLKDVKEQIASQLCSAMDYVEGCYGHPVDRCGKDLTRTCLLCHDPDAKFRFG